MIDKKERDYKFINLYNKVVDNKRLSKSWIALSSLIVDLWFNIMCIIQTIVYIFIWFRLKATKYKYLIMLTISVVIVFSTYNQANDSISELLLEWTDDNLKISTQRKRNDTTKHNEITKSDSVFKTFEELEKSLKDNSVKLDVFKPSYVPEGYQLNDISVNYDMQVHITIRYINSSIKDNEQSFTYSIYSVSSSKTDINSKLIQEKTSDEVEIYKALNGIEYYIFSNINWKVATFVKDYDIYSIYGLNDKIELKKIIDGLYQ